MLHAATTPTPSPSPTDLGPLPPPDPSQWWDWFVGVPLRIAITIVVSIAVLVLLRWLIHRTIDRIARGYQSETVTGGLLKVDPVVAERRAQRARTLGTVLRSTASIVVGTIAVLLVLGDLGVDLAPFIASAGVVGVALGFGAQSLVKDFLSGTFMLLEDQYGVGDTVDFGVVRGTVEEVALRVTKVRDSAGTLWYLRNGDIARVGNQTQEWANAVVPVVVAPDTDLDAARAAVQRAIDSVQGDPVLGGAFLEPPTLRVGDAITADGVQLSIAVRTRAAMQWDVERALRLAARDELHDAEVTLVSA
ncbi:MAG TPA: mechanosensitive ion channel domain-containing protein [Luteimicrobium sp.]|jgi:small conductance mechanosensitive channel|nr:mechanosensitive ion channel domain-containing protein [Luteimicrobium sp.]